MTDLMNHLVSPLIKPNKTHTHTTNRCMLGLANMLNAKLLRVEPPGYFYIYFGEAE